MSNGPLKHLGLYRDRSGALSRARMARFALVVRGYFALQVFCYLSTCMSTGGAWGAGIMVLGAIEATEEVVVALGFGVFFLSSAQYSFPCSGQSTNKRPGSSPPPGPVILFRPACAWPLP